jgi:hypothetical protein
MPTVLRLGKTFFSDAQKNHPTIESGDSGQFWASLSMRRQNLATCIGYRCTGRHHRQPFLIRTTFSEPVLTPVPASRTLPLWLAEPVPVAADAHITSWVMGPTPFIGMCETSGCPRSPVPFRPFRELRPGAACWSREGAGQQLTTGRERQNGTAWHVLCHSRYFF